MTATIIHIIPAGVFANSWQGSYKDTISRVEYFQRPGADYRQIRLADDNPQIVRTQVEDRRDFRFLIEYTSLPRTLKWVRRQFPESFIAVRSHNIEPLQHLDNNGWWPRRGSLWLLYGMLRLAAADLASKRYADTILSISDWENRVYWNRLPGRASVEWLPYHCPQHLLPDPPLATTDRRRIACLPTSQETRKSRDLVCRFIRFAEAFRKSCGDEFEFVLTGDLSSWNLPRSNAVTMMGMVSDLRSLLPTVRAVCLLSPLGYGFKTTIGDSIAHGCHVLAHPSLARRCPAALAGEIIPVDCDRAADVSSAASKLSAMLPCPDRDSDLRAMNHQLLSTAFGLNGLSNSL